MDSLSERNTWLLRIKSINDVEKEEIFLKELSSVKPFPPGPGFDIVTQLLNNIYNKMNTNVYLFYMLSISHVFSFEYEYDKEYVTENILDIISFSNNVNIIKKISMECTSAIHKLLASPILADTTTTYLGRCNEIDKYYDIIFKSPQLTYLFFNRCPGTLHYGLYKKISKYISDDEILRATRKRWRLLYADIDSDVINFINKFVNDYDVIYECIIVTENKTKAIDIISCVNVRSDIKHEIFLHKNSAFVLDILTLLNGIDYQLDVRFADEKTFELIINYGLLDKIIFCENALLFLNEDVISEFNFEIDFYNLLRCCSYSEKNTVNTMIKVKRSMESVGKRVLIKDFITYGKALYMVELLEILDVDVFLKKDDTDVTPLYVPHNENTGPKCGMVIVYDDDYMIKSVLLNGITVALSGKRSIFMYDIYYDLFNRSQQIHN